MQLDFTAAITPITPVTPKTRKIDKRRKEVEQQAGSNPQTGEVQSAVDEALQRYQSKAGELNEARGSLSKISDRIQALERNTQAAQTEADAAKAAWTALLRDGDGTLTKDVQKHRAAERAAYTLIEEYDVIRQELKRQFGLQNVTVAALASEYKDAYMDVLKKIADQTLHQAMEHVGLELGIARRLHSMATRGVNEIGRDMALTPDVLREQFLASIDRLIAGRSEEVSALVSRRLAGIVLDLTAVDMGLMRSPTSRRKILQELESAA